MAMKEYIVPVNITIRCDVVVEAESESHARSVAIQGRWLDDTRAQGEVCDWEVTGSPMVNE